MNYDFAWTIIDERRVYFARETRDESRPATAVCRLVSGVYAHEGFASLKVLRRRLHTTASFNEFDANLIKIAAKRCTFGTELDPTVVERSTDGDQVVDLSATPIGDPTADRTSLLGGLGTHLTDAEALEACRSLANAVPLEPERFASPRPVAALALDPDGRLLGAAVNNNVVNRLQHAEFNLVFGRFAANPIPAGTTIYASLSPCRMCAALLAKASVDGRGIRVVALVQDPGRYGRQEAVKVEIRRG